MAKKGSADADPRLLKGVSICQELLPGALEPYYTVEDLLLISRELGICNIVSLTEELGSLARLYIAY